MYENKHMGIIAFDLCIEPPLEHLISILISFMYTHVKIHHLVNQAHVNVIFDLTKIYNYFLSSQIYIKATELQIEEK